MAVTYTTNKRIQKPANNDFIDTWNVPVNADWDVIDRAFGGTTTISVTGVATGTISLTNTTYLGTGAVDVYGTNSTPIIKFTGTLTGNLNYQFPSGVGGFWYIYHDASVPSANTLTISSAGGGTSVVLTAGKTTAIVCDGTNVGKADTNAPTAAGSNTQIQFNNSGVLGASSLLSWDGTYLSTRALKISGSTSGFVGFQGQAAAGSVIYTLPATDGTNGQVLTTNGSAGLSWTTVSGGGGGSGVTAFSAGTTGFSPAALSTGNVTLSGTLNVTNGGTGATTQSGAQTNLNVPSTSGSGATGTWGISITGNAATATTATSATNVAGTALACGYKQIPQRTGLTTPTLAEVGYHLYGNIGFTIPNGVFSAGDSFLLVNSSTSTIQISSAAGTTVTLAGTTTSTSPRYLAANGIATVLCVGANNFLISGAGVS